MVGTAPLLMAPTYASTRPASTGPVTTWVPKRLGWALPKITFSRLSTPCREKKMQVTVWEIGNDVFVNQVVGGGACSEFALVAKDTGNSVVWEIENDVFFSQVWGRCMSRDPTCGRLSTATWGNLECRERCGRSRMTYLWDLVRATVRPGCGLLAIA